jgi:general nucleoside transport system permease protein
MRRIGFANGVALAAAFILLLSFFMLPLVTARVRVAASDTSETIQENIAVTATTILNIEVPVNSDTDEELDLGLGTLITSAEALNNLKQSINVLRLTIFLAVIAAIASLYPKLAQTARYIAAIIALAGIYQYLSLTGLDTGTDIAIAQQLHLGYWLALLAYIALAFQAFLPGKKDKIIETIVSILQNIHISRIQLFGAVLILLGLWFFITALGVAGDINTVLVFEPSGFGPEDVEPLPLELTIPTQAYTLILAVYYLFAGGLGIANLREHRGKTFSIMLIAGIFIFPTILILAAAGDRSNATTMLTESLRTATPIAIGAMAGLWCERSGVINIAIEGMMLFGAAIGFTVLFLLRTAYPEQSLELHMFIGVTSAVIAGGVVSLLHAWLSITFSTDQIVSGTVINILALGVTSFIRREVLLSNEGGLDKLPIIEIPILSKLPAIGPIFKGQPIFYLMFIVIIVTHIVLFQTRWGLRTRAVGENPEAADTLGIKVNQVRWINVFIGGMIAGLAGAWLSMEAAGRFTDGMTGGKGFIALAALIFGKWTPAGAFGGSLLFGFSEALGFRLQIENVSLPPQFLQMVPYIVTLIVLAGFVGRAIPPKAIGVPYKKE